MNIYQPYFYIIQNKNNGKYYAGSKYSKDKSTNPDLLLTEGGYKTSSKLIQNIIENFGLNIFVVRKIKTFETSAEAWDYETRFLKKVNARHNLHFYNSHNNDGIFDINNNKKMLLEIYGVDNFAKSELFPERFKKTCLEKYGVEHHLQNPEIYQKLKNTCLLKYGVDHPSKSELSQQNRKNNSIRKYGVDHPNKSFVTKEKVRKSNLEKYGVTHFAKTDLGRKNHRKKQSKRNNREIVIELKSLIKIALELEINIGDYGLNRFWWQKSDENLKLIKDNLVKEIESRKSSNFIKKTKREKMQAINAELMNRDIVKEIKELATIRSIKLGPGWWRKGEEKLIETKNTITNLM